MEYEYIGAIKIKDGLFLGDQFAAQDLEFVVTNKVTRIINCAGKQIPNHWESIGISYLTFPWLDNDTQTIFDVKDEVVNQCYKFIEDALNQGESVIVHSVRGHNRSVCVLCLYFMKKFRWTLYKTLQYLHSRRPDLEIRANFFNQLLALESKFQKQGFGAKTYNWDEIFEEGEDKNEESLLRNTYLNAQAQGVADFKDSDNRPKQNKIKWLDNGDAKGNRLVNMTVPPYEQIDFAKRPKPKSAKQGPVPSIIKAAQQETKSQPIVKPELPIHGKSEILPTNEQPLAKQNSFKELKQTDPRKFAKKEITPVAKREEDMQMSLNQIANKQLQQRFTKEEDPQAQFSRTADSKLFSQKQPQPIINQKPFSQTYQVNNFVGSQEQWNPKPPAKPKKQEFPGFGQSEKGRPSTAPNQAQKAGAVPANLFRQNKNPPTGELIITPYKRQSSLGSRTENNTQPQNQFKPTRQRGFSPQNVYSNNPYAQKSFKPWRK